MWDLTFPKRIPCSCLLISVVGNKKSTVNSFHFLRYFFTLAALKISSFSLVFHSFIVFGVIFSFLFILLVICWAFEYID